MESKMSLILRKETITKLSDEQMKKFVGGLANAASSKQSCNGESCNSMYNAGSCGQSSCNCVKASNT
jgi:hypothetical protein